MLKVYGLLNISLLSIVIFAFFVPKELGLKVIAKVTDSPFAILIDAGDVDTEKSVAPSPESVIYGTAPINVRVSKPVLLIVKIRVCVPQLTETLPKSVLSIAEGVISPLIIATELPIILIAGPSSLIIVPIACAVVFDVLLAFESLSSTVSFGSLV